MNVKIDLVLKLIRQAFIILGTIGTYIGIEIPKEAQEGVEAIVAALGPFLISAGLMWSWVKDVIRWIERRNTK